MLKKGFQQSVWSNSIGLTGNVHHPADSLNTGHGKAIYGLVSASIIFADVVFLPRRRSNWLHCRRRSAFGRDGHLLLDPLHFHVIISKYDLTFFWMRWSPVAWSTLSFWQLRTSCELTNGKGDKQSGCRGWEGCCPPRSCPSWWRPWEYQVILNIICHQCLFVQACCICLLLLPSISILREYQVTLNNIVLFSIITVALIWLCRTSQKIWRSWSLSFLILDPVLLDPWSLILSFLILQFNSPSLKYSYPVKLRHHKYYQWVCFTLYFQAILFYIPRFLIIIWIGVINWAPAVLRPTGSRWIVLDVNFDKPRSKTLIYGCTKWRGSKTSIHVGRLMTF